MYAGILSDFFDHLSEWSGNWWFLGVIFAIAYLDSVIPVVPSETCVIIGGVAAGAGNQNLGLVIACGAVGAFLGDSTAYALGRKFAPRIERRAAHKPKFAKKLVWADEQIQTRGGPLLITARFIPGGRTVLTLASGITKQRLTWFLGWIVVATTIWATYASLLGFIGGKAFEDDHTKAFLLAFAIAITVTVLIEVIRHVRHRRAAADAPGQVA